MSKDGGAQVADANAPTRTSKNEPASTPTSRVAQGEGNGKEKNSVKGARELQDSLFKIF